ncbi:unnamed protein product [Phytophthora fragariaefolia]|uniref:Unnamed protein product n=1 Tax=Phytophthora fragariaefolia TaxID=1490495 RepID=A0A9W7D0W8_9STRA|nr:unnamed protein product [Phytophthora fragariaefolia]
MHTHGEVDLVAVLTKANCKMAREDGGNRRWRNFRNSVIFGGWLYKSELDILLRVNMKEKKTIFERWVQDVKSLDDLTALLNADRYTQQEYANVVKFFKLLMNPQRIPAP